MQLATPDAIRGAYEGADTAESYVKLRFENDLMQLVHERQVATIQGVLDVNGSRNALEVAPGPGRITREVRHAGRLVCLEYNAGMIAEGKAACLNNVEWMQGDAFDLPFDQEFDFVYSFRFIRHFHRSDRARLYEQIRRVLRPGGKFVLDAVNEQVSGPLRKANPDDYPIYDKLYRSPDELKTELKTAGFDVVRIEPVQRWFSLQHRAQILLGPRSRWLCRRTIRLLERLRRGPALEWIVTCVRV